MFINNVINVFQNVNKLFFNTPQLIPEVEKKQETKSSMKYMSNDRYKVILKRVNKLRLQCLEGEILLSRQIFSL